MEKIYGRTKTIQEDKVSGFCPGCMHSTVIKLIGEVLEDIPPQLDFFDAVLPIDAEMYRNKKQKTTPESAKEALSALLPVLEAQTDWSRDAIFEACKQKAEAMEKKNGWLLFPLGIALSGKQRTPGGGTDLACMMGRETTLERVKAAIEKLNG